MYCIRTMKNEHKQYKFMSNEMVEEQKNYKFILLKLYLLCLLLFFREYFNKRASILCCNVLIYWLQESKLSSLILIYSHLQLIRQLELDRNSHTEKKDIRSSRENSIQILSVKWYQSLIFYVCNLIAKSIG